MESTARISRPLMPFMESNDVKRFTFTIQTTLLRFHPVPKKFLGIVSEDPRDSKGRFRLCSNREEKHNFSGPNYVERKILWAEKIY